MNLKQTFLNYPNKARVFNNILRSQGAMHFICTYFECGIDIDQNNNFGDLETLNQFDMSLYEWFYKGCGMHTSINIPMTNLQDVEKIFDIKIQHENKTKHKIAEYKNTLELVRETHKKFYNEIESYNHN
jgi:phage tail tube protein FII